MFGVCLILLLTASLCGCCTEHDWVEATCSRPKHCALCGLEEGSTLEHTWMEATCTRPKTCSVCAATEGEANGHTWVEATCSEPKTCSVCGATEGEPLEHTWVEANCVRAKHCSVCGITEGTTTAHNWVNATYSDKKYCTVCGQTTGDVLTPSFENSSYDFNVTLGTAFDYTTLANEDNSEVSGQATLTDYVKYNSDDDHAYRDGWEWREVTVKFELPTGCRTLWGYTDYFVGMDSYPGADYVTYPDNSTLAVETTESYEYSWEGDTCVSYGHFAVHVPSDYKYLIFYVCSADYEDTHVVDPNTHFFNMN